MDFFKGDCNELPDIGNHEIKEFLPISGGEDLKTEHQWGRVSLLASAGGWSCLVLYLTAGRHL